jgi:hypothetical protein
MESGEGLVLAYNWWNLLRFVFGCMCREAPGFALSPRSEDRSVAMPPKCPQAFNEYHKLNPLPSAASVPLSLLTAWPLHKLHRRTRSRMQSTDTCRLHYPKARLQRFRYFDWPAASLALRLHSALCAGQCAT